MNRLNSLHKASLILAIFLMISLFPLPYGFYTLIRLATAIIAGCWAVKFFEQGKTTLGIIASAIVILFQPLIKITLDKLTWNIVDISLAVFLIILVFKIDLNKNSDIKN